MSYYDEDYYQEPSEFDEMVEEFKAKLAESVKEETKAELERLRGENVKLRDKVKNLDQLEREVAAAKRDYERRAANAERDAGREARKLKAGELLKEIGTPKFTVTRTSKFGEKCEQCDDNRTVHFKSPQGKDLEERCTCWVKYVHWNIEEMIAHSATVRNDKLLVWYTGTRNVKDDDWSNVYAKVLYDPAGLTVERLMEEPGDYGFNDKDAAVALVEALNKRDEGKTTQW
ncbi:hypothetical protein BV113_00290 [Glutamicibacter phage BIM BV-113]|nr:hypothetical protein BV113_00290 [Glutamicibacter phage BIM BV-113]